VRVGDRGDTERHGRDQTRAGAGGWARWPWRAGWARLSRGKHEDDELEADTTGEKGATEGFTERSSGPEWREDAAMAGRGGSSSQGKAGGARREGAQGERRTGDGGRSGTTSGKILVRWRGYLEGGRRRDKDARSKNQGCGWSRFFHFF
jgi:hypothetical protein